MKNVLPWISVSGPPQRRGGQVVFEFLVTNQPREIPLVATAFIVPDRLIGNDFCSISEYGSVETDMNRFGSHPKHENILYTKDPAPRPLRGTVGK